MRFKKILFIAACFFAACFILILGVFAALPSIVEPQLKSRLAKFSKIAPIGFEIEKLGLSSTFISHISVADGISIDGLNIKYAFKSIFSPQIRKIVVSGLTIKAKLNEANQIQIPGIEFETLSKQKPEHKSKQKSDQKIFSFLQYLPEKLILKNSKIILHAKGKEFIIPLEMLSKIYFEKGRMVAKASLYPFGEKINCLVEYDLEKGVEKVKITANSFNAGHLTQFVPKAAKQFRLEGPIDFRLSSVMPVKKWELYVSRVGIDMPVTAEIREVQSTFLVDQDTISGQGSMEISHKMAAAILLEYKADLHLGDGISFDLKLNTGKIKEFLFEQAENKVSIKSPAVSISVNGNPEKGVGKININAEHTRALSNIAEVFFPKIGVQGMFKYDKNSKPTADIVVNAFGGTADLQESKTKMSGISFEIPYQYPASAKNSKGRYSIANIRYNDQYRFSSQGRVVQTGMKEVKINGSAISHPIKKAVLAFNAAAGFENGLYGNMDFSIEPFVLTQAEVKKAVPQFFQDGEIKATVSAKGQLGLKNNKISSFLQTNIKNGSVHIPDSKFTATGVNAMVSFNNLLVPETIPGQVLTIDEVQVDKVRISDARVRFSIEDAASLLIENIRFKWCNGLVSTEAIRFPHETDTYNFSLYCDRLELTKLLEQVGAFNADGSGTLNGRIPIVYSNGNISFDNGFLFSTPGSGGKIKVENTDVLTAGIPLDSPQFAELDVAREALKNFNYKWAKLVFNTFEDTLYVNMELDGKPSHIMPFEYKKEIGRFVRVDAASPGSHFQGIKLDVNLNLPFNEVMKFGNKLKSILK